MYNFEDNLYDETIYTPNELLKVIEISHIKDDIVSKYVRRKKEEIEIKYYNAPVCFDIETTSFYDEGKKSATMYAWTLCINGVTIIGRTWEEFINSINTLKEELELNDYKRLVIYIQNYSYEFQWLQYKFTYKKVFAVDNRTPVYTETEGGIDFRCSYMLSGCALEHIHKFMHKYKVKKAVGDLDYNKLRHSGTPLDKEEQNYIMYDGKTVCGYIKEQIEKYGNITEIPMTKTGVVRALCRDHCLKSGSYRARLQSLLLDLNLYDTCKRAFAGGFTHANMLHSMEICENVASFDFSSSYPAVMCSELFPMGAPKKITVTDYKTFTKLLQNYCCVFDLRLTNIRRSEYAPDAIISASRCWYKKGAVLDNGRIDRADEIMTTITDVDFGCIERYYDFDSIEQMFENGERVCANFYIWERGYLPKELIEFILYLYVQKTKLKGVKGKKIEYTYIKELLNSCYGMIVTDIIRDEIAYGKDGWDKTDKKDMGIIIKQEKIKRYNRNKKRFLYYPWGVFVTAYARKNLLKNIYEVGPDYIYSDTDSIKLLNREIHQEAIDTYNEEIKTKLTNMCKFYKIDIEKIEPETIKGKKKPLGAFDYEGTYTRFKTLGAKRYILEEDGEIKTTVAGLDKSAVNYLKEIYGDRIFEEFKDGIKIPADKTGKLTHTYFDTPKEGTLIDYMGEEKEYKEESYLHLENASYELGMEDYIAFLKGATNGKI